MVFRNLALGALALGASTLVSAEKYVFEEEVLPHAKTLMVLHGFSVYHDESSSGAGKEFVGADQASVTFNQYSVEGVPKDTTFDGLQISVMKASDFHVSVKKDHFCCSSKDVNDKLCTQKDSLMVTSPGESLLMKPEEVYSTGVSSATPSVPVIGAPTSLSKSFQLKSDGMYYLVISNCGGKSYDGARLHGYVTVRADHGYLPSMYYNSMQVMGYALIGYGGLLCYWLYLCGKWRKNLFYIHYFTLFVLVTVVASLAMRYSVFKLWNLSGDIPVPVIKFGALLEVIRYISSLLTLLFACLGWGISTNQLSGVTLMWLTFISFSLFVATLVQKVILEHDAYLHFGRTTPATQRGGGAASPGVSGNLLDLGRLLEKPDALVLDVSIALLYASIISWIYESLVNLMAFLKEQKQTLKYEVFVSLYNCLRTCFVVVVLGMVFAHIAFSFSANQVNELTNNKTWKYLWIVQHLLEEGVYFVIMVQFMVLWQPHAHSREYAFSHQASTQDRDEQEMDQIVDEDAVEYGMSSYGGGQSSAGVKSGGGSGAVYGAKSGGGGRSVDKGAVWAEEGFDDESDEDEGNPRRLE